MLCHWDLSKQNILVDPNTGRITGVLDWEQACILPDWMHEAYPRLMQEPIVCHYYVLRNEEEWDRSCREGQEWSEEDTCIFESRVMRHAFDQQLEKLCSPWLNATRIGKDEDAQALRALKTRLREDAVSLGATNLHDYEIPDEWDAAGSDGEKESRPERKLVLLGREVMQLATCDWLTMGLDDVVELQERFRDNQDLQD